MKTFATLILAVAVIALAAIPARATHFVFRSRAFVQLAAPVLAGSCPSAALAAPAHGAGGCDVSAVPSVSLAAPVGVSGYSTGLAAPAFAVPSYGVGAAFTPVVFRQRLGVRRLGVVRGIRRVAVRGVRRVGRAAVRVGRAAVRVRVGRR